MQTSKKVLALFIAAIIAISVMVFPVNALTDLDSSATQNIAMEAKLVHEDGTAATTLTPGETVKYNIYMTAKDAEARVGGGMFLIFYNNNIYEFVSRTWVGPNGIIDDNALFQVENAEAASKTAFTTTVAAFTATETAYGWNEAANIQVKNVAGTNNTNAYLIKANSDKVFLSVQFKVKDSVAAGTESPIGIPVCAVAPKNTTRANYTYIQTYTASNATAVQNKARNLYVMDTILTPSVASAGPTTPVEYQTAQIRFKGITATGTAADYQGTFDVRTVAQISEANFATFFTDETTAKAKITDFGFVYAAKSNVATFDEDTAKAVAEGGSAANYVKVPVTYMQHTGGNYIFTCLISNIADADKTDGVNCLGYVCFDGTYYYFDAAESVDYATLYARMPA